jgi:hypothetical protein
MSHLDEILDAREQERLRKSGWKTWLIVLVIVLAWPLIYAVTLIPAALAALT